MLIFFCFTALDWGGVRREWFELLTAELFDPERSGLFKRLQSDNQGLVSDVQNTVVINTTETMNQLDIQDGTVCHFTFRILQYQKAYVIRHILHTHLTFKK